jgi:hypothetical protein
MSKSIALHILLLNRSGMFTVLTVGRIVTRLKRVAVIGTGATSVKVLTRVAKLAEQLYVMQRSPFPIMHSFLECMYIRG